MFDEFAGKMKTVLAVSATPGPYEIGKSSDDPDYFFGFDPTK